MLLRGVTVRSVRICGCRTYDIPTRGILVQAGHAGIVAVAAAQATDLSVTVKPLAAPHPKVPLLADGSAQLSSAGDL